MATFNERNASRASEEDNDDYRYGVQKGALPRKLGSWEPIFDAITRHDAERFIALLGSDPKATLRSTKNEAGEKILHRIAQSDENLQLLWCLTSCNLVSREDILEDEDDYQDTPYKNSQEKQAVKILGIFDAVIAQSVDFYSDV